MIEREFIEIAPGITQLHSDLTARMNLERPYDGTETDSTDDHEGAHLVVLVANGRWAKKASRIPGPGYLGYVEGDVDTESAMAADAMGFGGTGHDKRLAARLGDPGVGARNARKTIFKNYEEWRTLSRAIHAEGEINGYQAEDIFEKAQNPLAKIEVESGSGERWNFITKVRKAKGHLILLGIENIDKKPEQADNVFDIRTRRPLSEKLHAGPKIRIAA